MQILHLSISTDPQIDNKVSQLLISVKSKTSRKKLSLYLTEFMKTWLQ